MTAETPVETTLELPLPIGSRMLVVGELLLGRQATPSSSFISNELAATIEAWDGPGAVVVNGDLIDFITQPAGMPAAALTAHPRLTAALHQFSSGADRTVVFLPGAADRRLAWDGDARRELTEATGGVVALEIEVLATTGTGEKRIRIEPGTRFDERFAFDRVPSPSDSPLGVHLLAEVVPGLRGDWAAGAERVADLADLPRFVSSRILYRRLGRWWWALLLPFVAAFLVRLPLATLLTHRSAGGWAPRIGLVALLTIVDLVLVGGVLTVLGARAWRSIAGASGERPNDLGRREARNLLAAGGTGLIVSHGRAAELSDLETGFFAATGACADVVRERPGRLGLPPVFVLERETGWVEVEAGAHLHVRLVHGRASVAGGATALERAVGVRCPSSPIAVVASWPHGDSWPPANPPLRTQTRIRRRAATAIALAGVLNLASALTPPLEDRLRVLLRWVPLAVPETATALVAVTGLSLLGLALGVRRGQRNAWQVAVGVLVGSVVLHLAKGADVEEAIVAAAVAAYLVSRRGAFRARSHLAPLRRALPLAVAAVSATAAAAMVAVEATTAAKGHRLAVGAAVLAVMERVVGTSGIPLPERLDEFLAPSLLGIGLGSMAWLTWLAVRPALAHCATTDAVDRARELVHTWGSGTLDYFALRSDKDVFLAGSSVVAFAIHGSVCLVSPDPVGPTWEREEVWHSFRRYAEDHGWTIAVLGASRAWLDTYRDAGMQALYVGDEAVVDVRRFTLDGGRYKALRQAVNRVAAKGYTISFHDPATAGPEIQSTVRAIVGKSRRGDAERGFSMTLGRMFDPRDEGLLLAVCSDSHGTPVAFCQFVPASGIAGYSLDVMRRDPGEHPNGILDFVVAETIRHLREQGFEHLGLNFAAMRSVLARETAPGILGGAQRWLLHHMSSSMQIESLWRFNAKFDPAWHPRYVVFDAPEQLVPVALAIARAESFWEVPLVGRWLGRAGATQKVA